MLKLALLFLGIQYASFFSMPLNTPKTQVNLHLERFNDDFNLYHIGISFKNNNSLLRYDYRPFCEPNKCEFKTINNDVNAINANANAINVNSNGAVASNKQQTFIDKLYRFYIPENVPNKTIYWGETSKSLEEVEQFEKTLPKKYILGINDCRHYVNRISLWALNKRTPIWSLEKLWNITHTHTNLS
jgi:hypothetical protein